MRQIAKLVLLSAMIASAMAATAQTAKPKYQKGTMLDTGEYDWCHYDCGPFDRPTFFFCVETGTQIMVGSHKADWFWQYDSSKMLAFRGKRVSVRYSKRSFWIVRTDGKEMRVRKDYSRDIFTNSRCTAEIHRHWLEELGKVTRPHTVPLQAVVVPQGPRSRFGRRGPYFWVRCTFKPGSLWDVCDSWDEKGETLETLECINASTDEAVVQRDLVVDPLTTRAYYEIHLRDGTVLADWAKGRINGKPTPGSVSPKPVRNPV